MFTVKRIIFSVILIAVCVAVPVMAVLRGSDTAAQTQMTVLSVWQIDSFEGGRGSRAQYLQNKANACFKGDNCYVTVTSVSADAARENMQNGIMPDIISYGAGFYGLDGLVNGGDFAYKTWCYGSYCLLTLSPDADFADADRDNTVINVGKDNLSAVAALLSGLDGADEEEPTGAYVKLIGGKYKYLLGTQRDVYRLTTRGVEFSVKPLTCFNDLYQNISVLSRDGNNYNKCVKFINYLLANNGDLDKVGMLAPDKKIYTDKMGTLENVSYDYTLNGFISLAHREKLLSLVAGGEINILKSQLK